MTKGLVKQIFSENFNRLLAESEYTQKTIAERLYVSKQTVSAWSTGQNSPRLDKLQELAELFGYSSADLLKPYEPKDQLSKPAQYLIEQIKKASTEKVEMMAKIWETISVYAR